MLQTLKDMNWDDVCKLGDDSEIINEIMNSYGSDFISSSSLSNFDL